MTDSIQAVAKSAANAGKTVAITAYHRDLYKACEAGRKAAVTMIERMQALLKTKYGATMPTYAQAKGDRQALKALATEKGLADDQWLRKPYNVAVKSLYGALPEAQSAAAITKRKLKAAGINVSKVKAGAKKGETAPRRSSEPETLEQYIARIGVYKVLEQCCLILEAVDATAEQAKSIHVIAKAMRAA